MKVILFLSAVLFTVLLSSCEFFISEQERNGINPKPFNAQAGWETNPYPQARN